MEALNLVLKLSERCNLNCRYCYYFNGLDQSFRARPAILKDEILEQIIKFLQQGIDEKHGIEESLRELSALFA